MTDYIYILRKYDVIYLIFSKKRKFHVLLKVQV